MLLSLLLVAASNDDGACAAMGRPIRWGIMGSGLISSDFVGALKALPADEAEVIAVGARSLEAAQAFATSLGVPKAHAGYEALANDPDVDVVYVGTVAQTHADCARIALAAGKPVLVEKPLAMNREEAAELVALAKSRGLFLLEGMWTRFFPAVVKARELLEAGAIGEVVAVSADFGWPADPDGEHGRTVDPVSGGVSMDVAMYPVAHVLLAAGATPPASVVATGSTRPAAGGGRVDWSVAAGLSGFGDRPALSATVLCTLDASTPEEVVYTGKKGTLRLHRPAHTPSRLTLSIAEGRETSTDETLEFALPPIPAGATRPLRCPGSAGLRAASRDGRSSRQARSPSTTPARKALCTRRPRSTGRCARAGSRPRSGRAGQVVGPADVGLAGEAGGSHRVKLEIEARLRVERQLALTHIAKQHSPGPAPASEFYMHMRCARPKVPPY
mmetsp:Transcript_37398/g.125201  ORF Transcript_37398/g.125201 Transcript_37398/m.125201 type:complete len:445 (+) Transcript_37398:125-1459(+)